MSDYEELSDEEIKEVLNEEKESFELNDESLFKHYYITYNDRYPFDLWFKSHMNITIQQMSDYIADMNDLSDEELIKIMDDLSDGTFRYFFIKYMDIYAKSSFDSLKEINDLTNIETPETKQQRSHKKRLKERIEAINEKNK